MYRTIGKGRRHRTTMRAASLADSPISNIMSFSLRVACSSQPGPRAASPQRRRTSYGSLNTPWSPILRHRMRASPSTVRISNVARPSGDAKDHVISKIPGGSHGLHAERRRPGRRRIERKAITRRHELLAQDLLELGEMLRLQPAKVASELRSNLELHCPVSIESTKARKSSPFSNTVTRPAATSSSTSRSRCCHRSAQNQA